ncbi:hypothetical protein LCGC14_2884350, partial [marine sediment metagenome]
LALAEEILRVLRNGGTWRIAVSDAMYRPEPEPFGEFGHKSQWNVDMLKLLGMQVGFSLVNVAQAYERDGSRISRVLIADGKGVVCRTKSLIVDFVK